VDVVRYNDKAPWPVDAANGSVLVRIDKTTYAYDPANWKAVEVTGPVAKISASVQTIPKRSIYLDGTKSVDPDGSTLTYAWYVKAPGAEYELLDETSNTVTFQASVDGEFFVKLIVSNGTKQSLPDIKAVQVSTETLLAEISKNTPFVYPTVTNDIITIDKNSGDVHSFRIVSLNGSTLMEGKLTAINTEIALNSINLDSGYIIVNVFNDESVYAKQIFYRSGN